jgi:hypothetical protein
LGCDRKGDKNTKINSSNYQIIEQTH